MIGIVVAMDAEYEGIAQAWQQQQSVPWATTVRGMLLGADEAVLVQCGMGKQAAFEGTRCLLEHCQPGYLISAGLAGALTPTVRCGDFVVASGVADWKGGEEIELLKEPEQTSLGNQAAPAAADLTLRGHAARVFKGRILSSDRLICDKAQAKSLHLTTQALCVEMEAAGVLRACRERQCTFAGIKIISDYADQKAAVSILRQQHALCRNLGKLMRRVARDQGGIG